MKSKRSNLHKSLLGIELDTGCLTVVSIARNGQGYKIRHTQTATLSLDPFSNDPELVGQEIRNKLDEMALRETRCVVCVPLQWIMSHTIELPELSPADEINFIHLQAEREFPFSAHDLSLSVSRFTTPGSRQQATIAALPANHANTLQKIFKAAKLRPISLTISIAALQDTPSIHGKILLHVKEDCIEFAVRAGNGIASLRNFECERHSQDYGAGLSASTIAREIRISLGQLSEEIRQTIREVHLFGSPDRVELVADDLHDSLADMGLTLVPSHSRDEFPVPISRAVESSYIPLTKTTIRSMLTESAVFEFLPPQINRFKLWTDKISSKSNLVLGGTAAAVLLILFLAFSYQYIRLSRMESEWNAIKEPVTQVEELQKKVKTFRPWFDTSVNSLSILKTLTENFPEDGAVWTQSIDIQNLSRVTCSGFAVSSREWLIMLDKLRTSQEVMDLKVDQYQGTPLQFAINFRWLEGMNDGQ